MTATSDGDSDEQVRAAAEVSSRDGTQTDPEIAAIRAVIEAISGFDEVASKRILWYATDWNRCRFQKHPEPKEPTP